MITSILIGWVIGYVALSVGITVGSLAAADEEKILEPKPIVQEHINVPDAIDDWDQRWNESRK